MDPGRVENVTSEGSVWEVKGAGTLLRHVGRDVYVFKSSENVTVYPTSVSHPPGFTPADALVRADSKLAIKSAAAWRTVCALLYPL